MVDSWPGISNELLVPAQEALAVADRLVLAREPAVDDLLDHDVSIAGPSQGTDAPPGRAASEVSLEAS
jgi:hypothetical protein